MVQKSENSEQKATGMVKSEHMVSTFYSPGLTFLHRRLLICWASKPYRKRG